jgi:methylated-DNA-[protein]-cysteine S-methyltransferase
MLIMATRHTLADTELGQLTLVADGGKLTGVYFPHHWYLPSEQTFGPRVDIDDDPLFTEAAAQLNDYFAGRRTSFEIPVATEGDAFQERVWALLNEIPFGGTTTYGALAESLGNKSLAQRVGQAVGHNPLSVVIPCHRVVGSDGALTGYAGGLGRKRFLLDLEEPAESRSTRLF